MDRLNADSSSDPLEQAAEDLVRTIGRSVEALEYDADFRPLVRRLLNGFEARHNVLLDEIEDDGTLGTYICQVVSYSRRLIDGTLHRSDLTL